MVGREVIVRDLVLGEICHGVTYFPTVYGLLFVGLNTQLGWPK